MKIKNRDANSDFEELQNAIVVREYYLLIRTEPAITS